MLCVAGEQNARVNGQLSLCSEARVPGGCIVYIESVPAQVTTSGDSGLPRILMGCSLPSAV